MKIENLNVKYGDKSVFSNFNLDIIDGQVTCLLGPSGVGKTTLLNHILSVAKNSGKKVSIAFQEPRLFEHLTVYENLNILGFPSVKILDALNSVGLENCANKFPSKLSGGEKQRVNFVRALLCDFDVLLLDEPFSSLDVKLKIALINLLVSKIKGKTVIFVTHDVEEALMLSSIVVLIKDGTVLLNYPITKNLEEREYGKLDKERQVLLNAQLL
ncbi:MAG: ABC transporter ATP-binding protein [Clostridia bacterium]|nr:ABC transporter ATP-binding protein [Clostridia bacterium]